MPKRRSEISLFSQGGLLVIFLLASALPGCKKDAPQPAQVQPLPAKTVQAAPGTGTPAAAAKPVQTVLTSAKNAVPPLSGQTAVQKQISTVKLPIAAGAVSLDFTNKRDPFKPFVQAPPKRQVGLRNKSRDPLPIQRFDTEKFRVSGIITGIKENSALVIDPAGKGHIVKTGMPFGASDGRVKRITSTAIEIEENFMDDFGKVKKRIVKLTLLRKK